MSPPPITRNDEIESTLKAKLKTELPLLKGAIVEKSPSIFKGKLKGNPTTSLQQVNGDMTSVIVSSRNSIVNGAATQSTKAATSKFTLPSTTSQTLIQKNYQSVPVGSATPDLDTAARKDSIFQISRNRTALGMAYNTEKPSDNDGFRASQAFHMKPFNNRLSNGPAEQASPLGK